MLDDLNLLLEIEHGTGQILRRFRRLGPHDDKAESEMGAITAKLGDHLLHLGFKSVLVVPDDADPRKCRRSKKPFMDVRLNARENVHGSEFQ